MKQVAICLIIVIGIFFLGTSGRIKIERRPAQSGVNCVEENENAKNVIGKWVNEANRKERIQVFEDGTAIFTLYDDERIIADYMFIDKETVRVDPRGVTALSGSAVFKINCTEDKLFLFRIAGAKPESFYFIRIDDEKGTSFKVAQVQR